MLPAGSRPWLPSGPMARLSSCRRAETPTADDSMRRSHFAQLDRDSDVLAQGLRELGVVPGTRLALLVKPSIDFVSLVFALFKAGAVSILIDPGMGKRNLLGCLEAARPAGFVAIPAVQAIRVLSGRRFAAAKLNLTVGRRWFWGGPTIAELRSRPWKAASWRQLKPRTRRPLSSPPAAPGRPRACSTITATSIARSTRSAISTASSRAKSTWPASRCSGCSMLPWASPP